MLFSFVFQRLQPRCEQFVRRREHEAALEVELNPQFLHHCKQEVYRLCGKKSPEEVIDCMKMNIPKVKGHECISVSTEKKFLLVFKSINSDTVKLYNRYFVNRSRWLLSFLLKTQIYCMTLMVTLAVLFLGGIMFGRVTKRVLREAKNS